MAGLPGDRHRGGPSCQRLRVRLSPHRRRLRRQGHLKPDLRDGRQRLITATRTLSHEETAGLGAKVAEDPFQSQFAGLDRAALDQADAISGATFLPLLYQRHSGCIHRLHTGKGGCPMKRKLSIFTRGIVRETQCWSRCWAPAPPGHQHPGLQCPGHGMATALVLICSNMAISALKHVIPGQVRIPCYIVVIASFVTIVQMLIRAFVPALNDALGIYLPLIVVNCIILGRAEMFANKHSVLDAALTARAWAGVPAALLVMASIREVFGNGTWYGMELPLLARHHVSILTMAPGSFCVFGLLIAAVNKLSRQHRRKQDELACSTCPAAAICGQQPNQEQEVADS